MKKLKTIKTVITTSFVDPAESPRKYGQSIEIPEAANAEEIRQYAAQAALAVNRLLTNLAKGQD